MIAQARMEVAAEHDHQANLAKQPAVNKLKMLPEFEQVSSVAAICVHMRLNHTQPLLFINDAGLRIPGQLDATHKARERAQHSVRVVQIMVQRDLHEEFLDGGVLGVFKAWIEPMQDGSLPNLKIRTAVLRALLGVNFFFEVCWLAAPAWLA